MNPGDTIPRVTATPATSPLNEGRGVNPGDTIPRVTATPATSPLNEGRGVNPGDTCSAASAAGRFAFAQRRPGREPRRHCQLHEGGRTKTKLYCLVDSRSSSATQPAVIDALVNDIR